MFLKETKNEDYMQFVLTHACNRTCKFCIDYRRGDDAYMSKKSLIQGLEYALKNGIKDILLIGGEPTLHPQFREFCQEVKNHGFNLIVTTNFDNRQPVYENSDLVDSWNLSYYGQKEIPFVEGVDITLSGLIYKKGFLNTLEKLDAFIEKYEGRYHLKFSTFTVINDYTAKNVDPGSWIDELPAKKILLFDFIPAQIYRGHIIKRYDIEGPDLPTLDSFKCLVDGTITRSWENNGKPQVGGGKTLTLEEIKKYSINS